jgi:ATP diphosphatase
MAEEIGAFAFGDVVEAITSKLIRRHPHVFGEARDLSPGEVNRLWDEIKAAEKADRESRRRGADSGAAEASLLADVPLALPALTRAEKMTRKAATIGFDWPDAGQVIAKIEEEIGEVQEAAAMGEPEQIEDEIGDLLFAVANLARHFRVDPEAALRGANRKFARRFGWIEQSLAREGRSTAETDLEEMERLWGEAKAAERKGPEI